MKDVTKQDPKVVRNQEIAGIFAVLAILLFCGGGFFSGLVENRCEMFSGRTCQGKQAEKRDTIKLLTRGGAAVSFVVAGVMFAAAVTRKKPDK